MGQLSSKTNVGLLTAVISAVLLSIVGMSDNTSNGLLADNVKENTREFRSHEKLFTHPGAANEFTHLNKELNEIQADQDLTQALLAQNQKLLCKLTKEC